MKSIRRYLLASLILALVTGALLVAFFTYFYAAGEIDELYDKNMQQIADTVTSQVQALNLREYHIKGALGPSLRASIKKEQDFLIQIWDKSHDSVYLSHRAIPFPYQSLRGMQIVEFDGRAWRTYGTETDDFVIQISQPQKARNLYVREVAANLLYPLLTLIPIVGLFIWLAVGKSLMPLGEISRAITKRSAASLEPISEANIPVEIQPLVRELNGLLVRLHTSLEAQRRFTADAAHELRTPLTALQLQLGNLKRAKTEEERGQLTSRLQNGIDRATHLVKQLLALARVEPNAMEASMKTVDLAGLAYEIVKHYSEHAVEKNIDLGMARHEAAVVAGSAENLRILLENLLENALRYTPEGGRINVATYTDENHVVLEVQDNGIGIPKDERAHIFERFYRVLGTQIEGTGLGLSIASNIVEQHGGIIDVEDGIDGKGTSFMIRFPHSQIDRHA